MKFIRYGLIAIIGGFVIKKVIDVNSFYKTFDFGIKASLFGIRSGNIVVVASVQIDNPTSVGYNMSKPYIKIFNTSKVVVAKSVITNEKYDIKPKSSTIIDNIVINIPIISFLGLISNVAPAVYQKIKDSIQNNKLPQDMTIGAKFLTQTIFDFDILKDIIIDREITI